MPTKLPRHQVTETPDVHRALAAAARRWPGESRARLLVRLIETGEASLETSYAEATAKREKAIEDTSGKYSDAFGPDYLDELRDDWPA